MKRIYIAPTVNVCYIMGEAHLMQNMSFSTSKVSNTEDIGWVKEERFCDDDSWSDE